MKRVLGRCERCMFHCDHYCMRDILHNFDDQAEEHWEHELNIPTEDRAECGVLAVPESFQKKP